MPATVDPRREVGAHEKSALITIETAERLARGALEAIDADPAKAKALLAALMEETTRRTCTAVKRQELSDSIAADARFRVGYHLAIIESEARLAAEQARGPLAGHPAGPCADPDCEVQD